MCASSIHLSSRRLPHSRQRGFSLVEVLVSIVILSFGLLGMVGLQASALKSNRDARLQSEALGLARELAEMMRANPSVATQSTATNNPYLGDFKAGSNMVPATPSDCLNVGQKCANAKDVANAQMTEWLARANNKLPGIHVKVCMDTAPYDNKGLPQWVCNNNGNILYIKLGWVRENTKNEIKTAEDSRPYVILPVTPGGQL